MEVTVEVVVAEFGLPTVYRGEKMLVTGKVVGTTSGLAGSDFRSMLSGPILMTAETSSASLRLIEKPAADNASNGVRVPGGLVHTTCKLAGSHT